jgi:hypothetical protein
LHKSSETAIFILQLVAMQHLVTENEAKSILEPHLAALKTIMVESLEGLNRAIGAAGESVNNRGKCALFHSIAIEKAQRYFKGNKDIVITSKYQTIQVIFSGKIVGRIKKVNKRDLCANAKTVRNQSILDQRPDLFGFRQMTFVDIGYRIQGTWTEFERLLVICRVYDDVIWRISYKDVATINVMPKENEVTEASVKEEIQIKIKTNEQGKP